MTIKYEEPPEDEMDDNCVEGCRPADHKCGKKPVKIHLIEVGRGKVNEDIELLNNGRNDEEIAVVALGKCKKYLMSQEVYLEPDDNKGLGHWKIKVGMGYTVGYIKIDL